MVWSRGGEDHEFMFDVFRRRCLRDSQVEVSSGQLEGSFQLAKSGIISFHPSEKGNENKGEEWARRLLRIRGGS